MPIPTVDELGTILCDQCKKPVEKVTRDRHPSQDAWVYTVFCHGATEASVLPRGSHVTAWDVRGGYAFLQTVVPWKRYGLRSKE